MRRKGFSFGGTIQNPEMVSCSGRFRLFHPKFSFRMLVLQVVALLLKILVWFVTELGPLKSLISLPLGGSWLGFSLPFSPSRVI